MCSLKIQARRTLDAECGLEGPARDGLEESDDLTEVGALVLSSGGVLSECYHAFELVEGLFGAMRAGERVADEVADSGAKEVGERERTRRSRSSSGASPLRRAAMPLTA